MQELLLGGLADGKSRLVTGSVIFLASPEVRCRQGWLMEKCHVRLKGAPVPRVTQKIVAILVLVVAVTITHRAAAADFPAQIKAGEHRLLLNGWGARTKLFLELYVAGLYLTKANSNPAAIAAANEPMSIRVKITSGMVSQARLMQSLTDGFHNATNENVASIQSEINQFRKCLTETITKGDTFDFIYLPEHGVVINKNGKFKGSVAGIEFKKALFNIWLSDKPADANLKKAMLTQSLRR